MAAQTLILGADRCTKNYYMHKDWTGEWSRLPWDVEDAFPGDKRYGTGLCSPSECSPSSTAYCILSCEKFNSPLYCDRNHPQDIFYADPNSPEQDPRSTYNVLIDVLLAYWPTKEMYLTRLRTLMDEILATSFIDEYVRRTLQKIRKDALRDSKKWSVGAVRAIDQGVAQLLSQVVPKRRDQLFNEYAYMIPPSMPSNARVYVSHAQRNGDEAYVKLSNPNGYAVDVSFWTISTPAGWRYRLKPGTGWLIPPCVLHAPGSLCTYEPQWGSDVFGMYQNLVEGREVPWSMLVKNMPKSKHKDLDFIVDQLDWAGNVDPNFKDNHYLEPIPVADTRSEGYVDRWIVYGRIKKEQLFTAKELTLDPGTKCTIKDKGAWGGTCVQGKGTINGQPLNSPKLIRFHELTEDEYFCTEAGAKAGVTFENTSATEPLVLLRYFGPEVNKDAPNIGDYRKRKFD